MCYGTYLFKRVSKECIKKVLDKEEDLDRTVEDNSPKSIDEVEKCIKKVLDKEEDLDTIDANIVEIVLFNYYNRLSPAARSSFLGLMNKAGVRDVIIRTLSWYFGKIPESIRNEVLTILAENEVIDSKVAKILSYHFDKIPESIRNEVLLRIAAHDIDYISEILQENPYAVYTYITKAMLEIADFIQKSKDPGAPSAGILLDRFNEELNKPEPEKSKLKSIWSGIEKVLPSMTTMAEAVSKIAIVFN
jgi:hypothetical protein